jgi:cyanophycinase-like exopeptidase
MRVTKDTVKAFCGTIQKAINEPTIPYLPALNHAHAKQLEMLNESSRLVIYGGARDPGKTARTKLLRDMLAEAQHDHRLIVIDELVSNTERLSEAQ